MKKIFLIIILILGITILSGCGDKENFEFEFENFYGYFYTENTFEEENQEFTGFAYNLLSNKMIKVYKQKQNSGYIDSIIILKQKTTKDLLSFVEENQEKMKLDGYDFENQKEYETRCKDKKLKSIVISSILNGNLKNIYFTQAFIKNKDYVYIISFSSDNEDERDIFESDVKSIKCR